MWHRYLVTTDKGNLFKDFLAKCKPATFLKDVSVQQLFQKTYKLPKLFNPSNRPKTGQTNSILYSEKFVWAAHISFVQFISFLIFLWNIKGYISFSSTNKSMSLIAFWHHLWAELLFFNMNLNFSISLPRLTTFLTTWKASDEKSRSAISFPKENRHNIKYYLNTNIRNAPNKVWSRMVRLKTILR